MCPVFNPELVRSPAEGLRFLLGYGGFLLCLL